MIARTEVIRSFARGLDVLRSFQGVRTQTITDVAARTGITRAAARRFLRTLCEQGLARTDGKYFELTPSVLELGNAYVTAVAEFEHVRELLHDLTRALGESASAAVLDGSDVIYVARSPARHRIMTISLAVGTRLPAHATSMGQACLATLSHNALERYFDTARLEALTAQTITSKAGLKARLQLVAQRGYALVTGELETGLRSIAVAVSGPPTSPRLALNVSAHAGNVDETEMIARFLPALQEAARQINLAGLHPDVRALAS